MRSSHSVPTHVAPHTVRRLPDPLFYHSSIWGSSVGFCADLCTSSAQTLHRPVHHAGERVAEHILTGAERVLSVLESVLCHSLADRVADRAKWLASR